MDKSDLKIVIVEDDKNFGPALAKAIEEAGFYPQLFQRPDEVIGAAKLHVPHAYIIDCMLPKMSGVQLAQKLQEVGAEKIPIFFISGIYKDKNFMRDALTKTGAKQYLLKPIEPEEIVKKLEAELEEYIDKSPPKDDFQKVMMTTYSQGERLKALFSKKSISGYELPRLLSLTTLKSISGVINLKHNHDETIKIHIASGNIVQVEVPKDRSLFGQLLVEKNLITPERIDEVLSQKSKKPIGKRLVEANLVSPHIIPSIFAEQMGLRLSRLIKDISYDVKFEQGDRDISDIKIGPQRLAQYFSDWIFSKIDINWLRTFYLPWMENDIQKGPNYNETSSMLTLPPLDRLPNFLNTVIEEGNLQNLFDNQSAPEELIIGGVHLLVLGQMITFGRVTKAIHVEAQIERLKRLEKSLSTRNFFEILGVSKDTRPDDVKTAYHELAKSFHPDKVAPNAPEELRRLSDSIFSLMTDAYMTLKDDKQKATYIKELEQGQAELILKIETYLEEGKSFLNANQHQKALEVLQKAADLRPPTPEITLYLLWARLSTLKRSKNLQEQLQDIQLKLNKIPPEDRHNAIYYFVKGLFQKYIGETDLAANNFRHALSLIPKFVQARRELNMLELEMKNKSVDIMNADLKDVVGLLFKRKR